MLSIRFPSEVNLVGDSKETLTALVPYLEFKTDRSWRETIEKGVAEWWKTLEAQRYERSQTDQSSARVLGTLITPAR